MGTAPSVEADLAVLGGASPGTCKRGSDHRGFSKPPSWFCQPRCCHPEFSASLEPWHPFILCGNSKDSRQVQGPQNLIPGHVCASHWGQRPQ